MLGVRALLILTLSTSDALLLPTRAPLLSTVSIPYTQNSAPFLRMMADADPPTPGNDPQYATKENYDSFVDSPLKAIGVFAVVAALLLLSRGGL